MAEAKILITGDVIRSTNMADFTYTKYGSLQGFTYNSVVYRYCTSNISPGYYDFSKYQDLMASSSKTIPADFKPFTFALAIEKDRITVKQRKISDDFLSVCWFTYEFDYDGGIDYNSYSEIPIPAGTPALPDEHRCDHWQAAKSFYDSFIHKAIEVGDSRYADVLADIEQLIEYIESNIFSTLNAIPEYQTYILTQTAFWSDGITYNYNTYYEYLEYYANLKTFAAYFQSYQKKIGTDSTLVFINLASFMPPPVFNTLALSIKMDMLSRLANRDLANWQIYYNPVDDNSVVITILNSIVSDQDEFLSLMIDTTNRYTSEYSSLFVSFYYGLKNPLWGGGKAIEEFIAVMYSIWTDSSYNPYQNGLFNITNFQKYIYNRFLGTVPIDWENWDGTDTPDDELNFNAAPANLNYVSNKFIGLYFTTFTFYFDEGIDQGSFSERMGSYHNYEQKTPGKIRVIAESTMALGDYALYGTYNYLQPVSLFDSNQESIMRIPVINGNDPDGDKPENINSLIPIFVLKYIDDAASEATFHRLLGYFLDLLSLFAGGFGLLAKLRYIRALSGFTEVLVEGSEFGTATIVRLYVAAGVEALTLSASTVSFLFKLSADTFKNEPWYENLINTLTWIELLSATGSILSERLLKVSAKNLVQDFNANGYPDEFVNDTRGAEARTALSDISGLASEIAEALLQQFKGKILEQVNSVITGNKDFAINKIVNGAVTDTPLHTDTELDDIIRNGFANGLPKDEIEGLLTISYRIGANINFTKQIQSAELIQQTTNWAKVIKPRGYAYGFDTKTDFEDFGNRIADLVAEFDLPTTNISIQGSSIRNPNFKDYDIAILIDEDQLVAIEAKIRNDLKIKFSNEDGIMTATAQEKYKRKLKDFEKDLSDGIIKQIDFGKLPNGRSFMQEAYETGLVPSKGMDVSIIIKNRPFDLLPYLKLVK